MTIKVLSPAVYNLRQAIKAGKNRALGLVDDVASAATKPQITIKKPQVTIKSVTPSNSGQVSGVEILSEQNKATLVNQRSVSRQVDNARMGTTEAPSVATKPQITIKEKPEVTKSVTPASSRQVSGADILAEQNRTMLVNHRNTSSQVNNVGANSVSNPKRLNIKGVSAQPEYTRKFAELCNKNHGVITPEDIVELQKVFKHETGLTLHCFGNVRDFNKTLSTIADEVKKKNFPKEIKHIMIGHGSGNVATKNWVTSEGSVLKYINTNNKMKDGDLVLVACCEDGLGAWSRDFPGRGLPVELVPCGRFKNDAGRGPAKIVRRGEEIICGDYSLTDGLKLYD